MHDLLFAHQLALGPEQLLDYAEALQLPTKELTADLAAPEGDPMLRQDAELARSLKVASAPVLFVNGRLVRGAVSYERLAPLIDDEIKTARAVLRSGVTHDHLYDTIVGAPVAVSSAADRPVHDAR
jgi:predicted DsbA family dithiol-disulfide isomerase